MGILWTLCKVGPCTFRKLQDHCGSLSPTLLNTRLKELRQAGLIHNSDDGYAATELGQELYVLLVPLGQWSRHWLDRSAGDEAQNLSSDPQNPRDEV